MLDRFDDQKYLHIYGKNDCTVKIDVDVISSTIWSVWP